MGTPRLVFLPIALMAVLLLSVACNSSDESFVVEGKFQHFNQGELFVYRMEQERGRMDTVKLMEGKFNYTTELSDTTILSFVFPNFSEIPVIAYPGAKVKMTGDASNLKEATVTGTEENNMLSELQLAVSKLSPPEAQKKAEQFIREHPTSIISLHLVRKYFLLKPDADYQKAKELLALMSKASPKNSQLARLSKEIAQVSTAAVGKTIPSFSAVSIDGARLTNADLSGTVNVVCAWASWNFDSQNLQRQLKPLKRQYGSRLQLVSVCLDATERECRSTMRRDSITWPTVCDGRLWQSDIICRLGITEIPTVIIADSKGKIAARNLGIADMREKIHAMMK